MSARQDLQRIETSHSILRLVEEADHALLHELRTSGHARLLAPVPPDPAVQRDYIRRARALAAEGREIYWALEARKAPGQALGFIRVADLDHPSHFSFHSLIVRPGAPAFLAIDALFTAMQVGFEAHGFGHARSLTLRPDNERMRALHRSMGILTEDREDADWVYLSASRERFLARKPFFRRLGFGMAP